MWDFFLFNPWSLVNRRGSVAAETQSVSVSDTAVTYTFRPRAFAGTTARGTLFVSFAQSAPESTTGTLPIVFSCNGETINVTKAGGEALTFADIASGGVYEFFYERQSNTLQVLSGVAATVTAAVNGNNRKQ